MSRNTLGAAHNEQFIKMNVFIEAVLIVSELFKHLYQSEVFFSE